MPRGSFLAARYARLPLQLEVCATKGLFASHHLEKNVPLRSDWAAAAGKSAGVLSLRDEAFLRALGFELEHRSVPGVILRYGASKVALAVLGTRGTDLDNESSAFHGHSPVGYGLAQADQENLRYVLVLEGPTLRLYATDPAIGVGRRGRSDTFVEARLDLMSSDHAAYLWLLFSAEALRLGGSTSELLEQSRNFAVALGTRLRDRI